MSDQKTPPQRQARGQKRMESLLSAAEMVFAEVGYERATTNLIAQRASVSPGTLYQFFSNKESIAHALAEQYAERLKQVHERVFVQGQPPPPLDRLVDAVVDPFLEFHLQAPAFEALLVGAIVSRQLQDQVKVITAPATQRLVTLLGAYGSGASKDDLFWTAEISLGVFRGLLPVIMAHDGASRTRAVQEMKKLFFGYLKPVLGGS